MQDSIDFMQDYAYELLRNNKSNGYFGELEEGNILLQEHGNEVAFKNIKILELT